MLFFFAFFYTLRTAIETKPKQLKHLWHSFISHCVVLVISSHKTPRHNLQRHSRAWTIRIVAKAIYNIQIKEITSFKSKSRKLPTAVRRSVQIQKMCGWRKVWLDVYLTKKLTCFSRIKNEDMTTLCYILRRYLSHSTHTHTHFTAKHQYQFQKMPQRNTQTQKKLITSSMKCCAVCLAFVSIERYKQINKDHSW